MFLLVFPSPLLPALQSNVEAVLVNVSQEGEMTDLLSLQCQLSPGPQYDLQVERLQHCLSLIYRKDYQSVLFVFPPTKSAILGWDTRRYKILGLDLSFFIVSYLSPTTSSAITFYFFSGRITTIELFSFSTRKLSCIFHVIQPALF